MKPHHIILAEQYNDNELRLSYDRFFRAPLTKFSFEDTIIVPAHFKRQDDMPFMDKKLRNTIGRFVDKINAVMDRNNRIDVHMPEIWGRKITIYADNIFTLNKTRSYVAEILEAYSLGELPRLQAIGFIDEKVRESKKPKTTFNNKAAPNPALDPEIIISNYMDGVDVNYLDDPSKAPAFDSFDLDHGFEDTRQHVFDISEANNGRSNMPFYDVEKQDSAETQKAFEKFWNINLFEGVKATAFENLRSFFKNELSVNARISDYSSSRIELRGTKDNVYLAKQIGVRAVPLINEGKTLDQNWLSNALTDARTRISIKSVCAAQGTSFSDEEARKAQYKASLKGFKDIADLAMAPT